MYYFKNNFPASYCFRLLKLFFFCSSLQMTASNLAVCFAPSLFNLVNVKSTASPSLRRNKKQQGVPDSKEILEPAHECLVFMIKNSKALFTVSTLFSVCVSVHEAIWVLHYFFNFKTQSFYTHIKFYLVVTCFQVFTL